MKKKTENPFVTWINTTGSKEIAKTLKVHGSSVNYWRQGKVAPKFAQMKTIVSITSGAVSYENMIDHRLTWKNK